MPLFTPTGKMTEKDRPKSNSRLIARLLRGSSWIAGGMMMTRPFGALLWWKVREAESKVEHQETREPNWHGLPEAELTEKQEQAAQHEAARHWNHEKDR